MKKVEAKFEEKMSEISPYGVELDSPMQKNAAIGVREMKPPFPMDARGMGVNLPD